MATQRPEISLLVLKNISNCFMMNLKLQNGLHKDILSFLSVT